MMTDLRMLSDTQILATLTEAGVLPGTRGARLQRHPANFSRHDASRRLAMRVWIHDKVHCHLVVGRKLKNLVARTNAFAKANPEISCRTLFHVQDRGVDYFGQEHFGEFNLEEGLASRKIDSLAWCNAVTWIKGRLAATTRPYSASGLQKELEAFENRVLTIEWFTSLDRSLLRDAVFPKIREGARQWAPSKQWSNGDFIAKNILYDHRRGSRLIDCEFASETFFADADWFRLQRFSLVPADADVPSLAQGVPTDGWFGLYCWLQHAIRLDEIAVPAVLGRDLALIGGQLRELLGSDPAYTHHSILIGGSPTGSAAPALPESDKLELTWASNPTGDANLLVMPLNAGSWSDLVYTLNSSIGRTIHARLAPSQGPGILDLRSLVLRSPADNAVVWSAYGAELGPLLAISGNGLRLQSPEGVQVIHFGGTSQILLPRIDIPATAGQLQLVVTVRFRPSVEDFTRRLRQSLESDPSSLPFRPLYLVNGDPAEIPTSPASTTAQLFYPTESGYQEERSSQLPVSLAEERIWLEFDVPPLAPGERLRFDPINRPGLVTVRAITIAGNTNAAEASPPHVIFDATLANEGILEPAGDCVVIPTSNRGQYLSIGDDPVLLLPGLPQRLAGRPLRLSVEMQFVARPETDHWVAVIKDLRSAYWKEVSAKESGMADFAAKMEQLSNAAKEREQSWNNELQRLAAELEARFAESSAATNRAYDRRIADLQQLVAECESKRLESISEVQKARELQAAQHQELTNKLEAKLAEQIAATNQADDRLIAAHAELKELQSRHNRFLECIKAQQRTILNLRHRGNLATKELQGIRHELQVSREAERSANQDWLECRAQLQSLQNELASATTRIAHLEQELALRNSCIADQHAQLGESAQREAQLAERCRRAAAELHALRQRVLVRIDSLWRDEPKQE